MFALDIVLSSSDLMNEIALFLPIEDRINLRLISKQMRKFVDHYMISDLRYVQYHILGPFISEWKQKRKYNIDHQHRVVHVIMNRTRSLGIDNTFHREMVAKFYTQRLAHEVKLKIKPQNYQMVYKYGLNEEQLETIIACFDVTNYYAVSVLKKLQQDKIKERFESKEKPVDLDNIYKSLIRGSISLHDVYNINLAPYYSRFFMSSIESSACSCRMCIKKILEISVHINPKYLPNIYETRSDFIDKHLKTFEPTKEETDYILMVNHVKKYCVNESLWNTIVKTWKYLYNAILLESRTPDLKSDPDLVRRLNQYREQKKRRAENPDNDEDSGTESDREREQHLEELDKLARDEGW